MTDTIPSGTLLHNQRYAVIEQISEGGMGAIYLADDRVKRRRVAIKVARIVTPEARDQFQREAGYLQKLQHHGLPRVWEYFGDTQRDFLVMEYIPGEDLQAMVGREGRQPEWLVLRWADELLDALDFLHQQKPPIIHRDVKPSNLKLRQDETLVLVDFGIAKEFVEGQATISGAAAISPGYSPLEQYKAGGLTDARSDIYAAGATLYYLLTGQAPPSATDQATGDAGLAPPMDLVEGISDRTNALVLRALKVKRDERWPSAAAMRREVNAVLESIAGKPGSELVSASDRVSTDPDATLVLAPPTAEPADKTVVKPLADSAAAAAIAAAVATSTGGAASRKPPPAAPPAVPPPPPKGGGLRLLFVPIAMIGIALGVLVLFLLMRGGQADQPTPLSTPAAVAGLATTSPTRPAPSATPVPPTRTPTPTLVPPTPTPSPSASPSATPVPPTATPAPTATPTPMMAPVPLGQNVSESGVTFLWVPVPGAASYMLQTRSNRSDQANWQGWTMAGAVPMMTFDTLLDQTIRAYFSVPGITYAWRVAAVDAAGQVGPYSAESSFVYQPVAPTATPLPPPTAIPTPTPRPPTATPAPTATRRPPTPTPQPAVRVDLVQPADNASGGGEQTFAWSVAAGGLAAGQAYELIFWSPGQDPLRDGFGLAQPTTGNQATVNLDVLDAQPGYPLQGGPWQWGVRVVQTEPYRKLAIVGGPRTFTFVAGGAPPTEPPPELTAPPPPTDPPPPPRDTPTPDPTPIP